jgi:hypothetical protein
MKNKLSVGLLIFCLAVPLGTSAKTLNLRDFEEKLRKANELEGILANSPEGKLLKSLNNIADSIDGDKPNVKHFDNALTLVNSTDLIEELLPKDVSISFDKGFLAGSGLSVSDLANASYFLNSLNAKKLINMRNVQNLLDSSNINLASAQEKIVKLSNKSVSEMISELEQIPDIDLVQLSSAIAFSSDEITSSVAELEKSMNAVVEGAGDDLTNAAGQINSATQTLSYAAGVAMAAAAYSLDQAASAIANTISVGVTVDLEAAAQGLGFDDFASAVDAYNAAHGTNYTVDSARDALGQ